ncbi:MAG: lysine--tRNA ligase [Bacteroidota bacterium]
MSEQEAVRKAKRETLAQMGIDPYPAASFTTNASAQHILSNYAQDPGKYRKVALAGRIMSRRVMGAASFAVLQDATARIQLYIQRDTLCPGDDKTFYNTVCKKLLDIGDIIGVHGSVFTTQMGEITINVTELVLLSKALRPLPSVKQDQQQVYDAFTDPEQRYRQRYVDLLVNPSARKIFQQRTQIIHTLRQYLHAHGYAEVETPILQPIYGGALARPFKTHHNALDMPLYLRIANELYLKRLIVGGYEAVYEFAKDFRNEGLSRFHNPEFTMLELYVAYKDYLWMAEQVEMMITQVALALHGTTQVQVGAHCVDFKRPWQRFTLSEALQKFAGIDMTIDTESLRQAAAASGIDMAPSASKAQILDAIFSTHCEPKLIQPTFIMDYPVEMSPLAKQHRTHPELTERFEVICCGKELCNAFSELNDPIEQRKRLEAQLAQHHRGDLEAMVVDEDFLRALSYGMPPTAGVGIGIDRLTMLMTNATSIQEVIFFPQMRPEQTTDRS